jgi:hypothetical protein
VDEVGQMASPREADARTARIIPDGSPCNWLAVHDSTGLSPVHPQIGRRTTAQARSMVPRPGYDPWRSESLNRVSTTTPWR